MEQMINMNDLLQYVHPQWSAVIEQAMKNMDAEYLKHLLASKDWLPGQQNFLAAFSRPRDNVRFVLLGESPYPRSASANGYAFWDGAVGSLWSAKGLSKEVNRATSLRNWLKMLLFARGDLNNNFTQDAINKLDKTQYVQTASEMFESLIQQGFLLLNATLVYSKGQVNFHARQWRPFIHSILQQLAKNNNSVKLILFGRIAQEIPEAGLFPSLKAEHPYNISFITNPEVVEFFKPMDLLKA
jgi:uracil-DNA glycosylase